MTIHTKPFSNSQGVQPSLTKHFLIVLAKVVCVAVVLSNISACSKRKVVVTSDDSVEYKSARSLPPLIKPTQGTSPSVASTESQVESVSNLEPVQSANVDKVVAPSGIDSASVQPSVKAVIRSKSNSTRLSIDSGWDAAWVYLTEKLKGSDLTVFSRNKSAGRIAIGCSDVGEGVIETKAGGWSIFNRKKPQASEYCSLQMNKKGRGIHVSVLDRVGVEAGVEKARLVLEQLQTQ